MTPEVADLLGRAKLTLGDAKTIQATTTLHAIVAREAYNAVLQAARAVLLDRTDRVVKTHRGVLQQIGLLAQGETRIGTEFATFLGPGFEMKQQVDYGPRLRAAVTRETAEHFVATAARLLAHAEWLLTRPDPPPAA